MCVSWKSGPLQKSFSWSLVVKPRHSFTDQGHIPAAHQSVSQSKNQSISRFADCSNFRFHQFRVRWLSMRKSLSDSHGHNNEGMGCSFRKKANNVRSLIIEPSLTGVLLDHRQRHFALRANSTASQLLIICERLLGKFSRQQVCELFEFWILFIGES